MRLLRIGMLLGLCLWRTGVEASPRYEDAPVFCSDSEARDPLPALIASINDKSITVDRSSDKAFVRDLLRLFEIPVESQVLVFSKTSFQNRLISPEHPRALFYSKDVYLGWVPGGSVEIITNDPELGPVFYVLNIHDNVLTPKREASCLDCHGSSRTHDVPGMLVRSVFPADDGQPILSNGSTLVDHSTPLDQRWGGWYVTGDHQDRSHQGNMIFERLSDGSARMVQDQGRILADLDGIFDTRRYLTNTSDIVALMVLEHQAMAHNAIAKAQLNTRLRLHQNQAIAELLQLKPGELTETSQRVLNGLAENLLDVMFFYDELPLSKNVLGQSGAFKEAFEKQAGVGSEQDSLYTMDLVQRLFRYRFSYMVYAEAFADLPPSFLRIFFTKLGDVLTADDPDGDKYADIEIEERLAIARILHKTLPREWLDAMGANNNETTHPGG